MPSLRIHGKPPKIQVRFLAHFPMTNFIGIRFTRHGTEIVAQAENVRGEEETAADVLPYANGIVFWRQHEYNTGEIFGYGNFAVEEGGAQNVGHVPGGPVAAVTFVGKVGTHLGIVEKGDGHRFGSFPELVPF